MSSEEKLPPEAAKHLHDNFHQLLDDDKPKNIIMKQIINRILQLDDWTLYSVIIIPIIVIFMGTTEILKEIKDSKIQIEAIKNGLIQEYSPQAKKVIWVKKE